MAKGSRSRNPKRKKPRRRAWGEPLGRLDADALLAHRELEYLRDAGRAGAGKVSGRGRKKLAEKARKLEEARRVAEKYGSKASTPAAESE